MRDLLAFGLLAYGGFLVMRETGRPNYAGWSQRDADIDVVARTVWGEARGEGVAGMTAVAAVIRNRVRNPGWWGHDWQSVCLKDWQFSAWNPGDPNRAKMLAVTPDDPEFAAALRIAARAVLGTLDDPTGGATHYLVSSMSWPSWARADKVSTVIGGHTFFVGVG